MEDTNRTTLEKCASDFKTDIIKYPLMAMTSLMALRSLIGAYRRIGDELEYENIEKEQKRRNRNIVTSDPLSFVQKEALVKEAGLGSGAVNFAKGKSKAILKYFGEAGKNLLKNVKEHPGKAIVGTGKAGVTGFGLKYLYDAIKGTTDAMKSMVPEPDKSLKTLGVIGASALAGFGGYKLMDEVINSVRKKQLEKELDDTEKEYAKRILLLGELNKSPIKTASIEKEAGVGTAVLTTLLGALSLPVLATAYKSYKTKLTTDPALSRKDDILNPVTPDMIITNEEKEDADKKVRKLKLIEDTNNPKNQLQAMAEDPGVFNQTEPVESSKDLQLTDYSGLDAGEMKDIQDPETQRKVACELALENILSSEKANVFGIQDLVRVVANGDVEAIEKSASTYKNEEAIHETVAVLAPFAANFDDISTARVKLACMWISNNENVRPLVENTIHTQNILSMPQIVKVASEMPKEMEPYMDFLAYKDMLDSRDFAFSLCDEGFEKSASSEDVFDARDIPFDDEAVLFDLLAGKHIKTASKDMDIESKIVDQIAKSIY